MNVSTITIPINGLIGRLNALEASRFYKSIKKQQPYPVQQLPRMNVLEGADTSEIDGKGKLLDVYA
jgi:hypothetical protein